MEQPESTRLLLVEDDEMFAEEFSAYFAAHGFAMGVSKSIGEALSALAAHDTDLVILDQFLRDGESLSRIHDIQQPFPVAS